MKTLNISETQQVSGGLLGGALMIYAGANQWNFPMTIAGSTLYACALGNYLNESGFLFMQLGLICPDSLVLKASAAIGLLGGSALYGIGYYTFSGSKEPAAA